MTISMFYTHYIIHYTLYYSLSKLYKVKIDQQITINFLSRRDLIVPIISHWVSIRVNFFFYRFSMQFPACFIFKF